MLGDVQIAEPGALICFAGPRVIQQTIREQLPDGFQRAEYLRDHGMVDMVVHRHKLRQTLARLVRVLMAPTRVGANALTDTKSQRGVNGGKGYINGTTSPDAADRPAQSSTSAKAPSIIEAEPVSDNERFDPGRRAREIEAKPAADAKPTQSKSAPKS